MHTGLDGDFLTRIENIKTSLVGGKVAVHKPLLLLLTLGRIQRKEPRLTSFKIIEKELSRHLERYWPQKGKPEVLDPFWRLQNDGLWEVCCRDEGKLVPKKGTQDEPTLASLREADASGGFLEKYDSRLRQRPDLLGSAVRHLLSKYLQAYPLDEVASAVRVSLR
jgi:putative restriction endonuclease